LASAALDGVVEDGVDVAAKDGVDINRVRIPIVKAAAIVIADNFHRLFSMSVMPSFARDILIY
jgi:hypothetical protein